MSIRILLADDHGVMRAGLAALLKTEPQVEVIGEASDGEEALRLASETQPDILLLDIGMPGMDGIEVTLQLKKRTPQVKVLILSVYEDESMLREAIKAGASGYIIKRAVEDELTSAIRAVARGDLYIHPGITHLLLKNMAPAEPQPASLESLTPREREVFDCIIQGFTNRQVAETLSISVRTVEGHRASLLAKLGLKNRLELVRFAEQNGLLPS